METPLSITALPWPWTAAFDMNIETLVLNSSNSAAFQSLNGSNTWIGPSG